MKDPTLYNLYPRDRFSPSQKSRRSKFEPSHEMTAISSATLQIGKKGGVAQHR